MVKGYPAIRLTDAQKRTAESLVEKGLVQYILGEYYLTEKGVEVFKEMRIGTLKLK